MKGLGTLLTIAGMIVGAYGGAVDKDGGDGSRAIAAAGLLVASGLVLFVVGRFRAGG